MRVRIRGFQLQERRVIINGCCYVAKFAAQLDHFIIYQMKLMECPERGLIVWSPSQIRLSMEGREMIQCKAKKVLASREALTAKSCGMESGLPNN